MSSQAKDVPWVCDPSWSIRHGRSHSLNNTLKGKSNKRHTLSQRQDAQVKYEVIGQVCYPHKKKLPLQIWALRLFGYSLCASNFFIFSIYKSNETSWFNVVFFFVCHLLSEQDKTKFCCFTKLKCFEFNFLKWFWEPFLKNNSQSRVYFVPKPKNNLWNHITKQYIYVEKYTILDMLKEISI